MKLSIMVADCDDVDISNHGITLAGVQVNLDKLSGNLLIFA